MNDIINTFTYDWPEFVEYLKVWFGGFIYLAILFGVPCLIYLGISKLTKYLKKKKQEIDDDDCLDI